MKRLDLMRPNHTYVPKVQQFNLTLSNVFFVMKIMSVLSFAAYIQMPSGIWSKWLSGRVLDSRLRGHKFVPHWLHCVVSLSKTCLSLLSTGSEQEDPSQYN